MSIFLVWVFASIGAHAELESIQIQPDVYDAIQESALPGANRFIYEVSFEIDKRVETAFKEWLDRHVQEVLKFDGFENAQWFEHPVRPKSKRVFWTIQYALRDQSIYNDFEQKHSKSVFQDGIQQFGGKFIASQRTYQQVKTY